jgi:Trk K+ transport system NAD-binding subunit
MLSLLGSLLGFGTSFLPKVMDYFQDRSDKAHELQVMEVQIRQQKELASQKLEMVNVEADVREIEALQKSMQPTGVAWVDGLRGSVRPVITYAFFGLFVFVEVSAYLSLTAAGISGLDAVNAVWDEDTKALFAAVIAFWFGGRAINRGKK